MACVERPALHRYDSAIFPQTSFPEADSYLNSWHNGCWLAGVLVMYTLLILCAFASTVSAFVASAVISYPPKPSCVTYKSQNVHACPEGYRLCGPIVAGELICCPDPGICPL
uniref:Uncharacterized protein n=1 Tax=Mycena chlorophos TaxID=658473 RepID=A0ABQ0L360_MYCCL|nr:predicted protein [Mycena chlorophos]